jgi:hypothetical protein
VSETGRTNIIRTTIGLRSVLADPGKRVISKTKILRLKKRVLAAVYEIQLKDIVPLQVIGWAARIAVPSVLPELG